MPGRMAGAEVGASTGVDLAASMAAEWVDFMVASQVCTGPDLAGFHGGGFHGDRFHDGRFGRDRFRNNRFFFGGAFAYPYGWDYSPDYSYYDYSQPYSSQAWYYCSDPAGYYPYVTQCNTGWQAVPTN
jgi:hypothetical protein